MACTTTQRGGEGVEGGGEGWGDAGGVGDGDAGVDAEQLDVGDGGEGGEDGGKAAGGEHERVAAGEDDLADGGAGAEPGVGGVELGVGEEAAFGADVLPAEAEAAIDGADEEGFEERPVGVAVDDAGEGGEGVVADGVGGFTGGMQEFVGVGDELEGDGVGGVLDEGLHGRGDGDGVAGAEPHLGRGGRRRGPRPGGD